jgi:hypothetical protein
MTRDCSTGKAGDCEGDEALTESCGEEACPAAPAGGGGDDEGALPPFVRRLTLADTVVAMVLKVLFSSRF